MSGSASRAFDVVIAGAGPSGFHAALATARGGLKTLLIERHGFLGGMNTAALVGPIMSFHAGKTQIVKGTPGELFEKLKERGGTPGHLVDPIWANTSMTPIDTEIYKALLFQEIQNAKVNLSLHSTVVGGALNGETVESLKLATKQGLVDVSAKYFIDATGDGDLAAALGCTFQMGRKKDQLTQPMTLMFKMAGVDEEAVQSAIRKNPNNFYLGLPLEEFLKSPRLAISGFYEEVKKGKEHGDFPFDRDRVLFFGLPRKGEVSINTLRISHVNGTRASDMTRAEAELRGQVPLLEKFLKKYISGFKNAYVSETASQVGVRETRHIEGHYLLTAEDVLTQRKFEDTIAHASYPIDIHSPDGSGMNIVDPRKDNPESFYNIPYRCLVPKGVRNLLVTGRCISAEHEASASARISAVCMALGQAAGTAIRVALKENCKNLSELQVKTLQSELKKEGAFLEL